MNVFFLVYSWCSEINYISNRSSLCRRLCFISSEIILNDCYLTDNLILCLQNSKEKTKQFKITLILYFMWILLLFINFY